jgi:hypothetical protein
MGRVTFREASKRFETHCRNLKTTIEKVEKVDKNLADELAEEYYGFLQAMLDILDDMKRILEH